ncbi:MAG: DNA-binding protein [Hyphomicrobiales bacterium]|nr:MAG: DNA-binding protein [Hyphomicrobiales bacterium]
MAVTPDALFAFLAELGIETKTIEHPPLFTVEESQSLRGEIPGAHCKNLFVKDKKGRVFLIVAEEEATIDLKQVHTIIGGSGRVSFGKADLLGELLGVEPGSVTPFGVINDTEQRVSVVLDAAMMAEPVVNYHPLINTMTTTIASGDLVKFIQATGHEPQILAVSAESQAMA